MTRTSLLRPTDRVAGGYWLELREIAAAVNSVQDRGGAAA
jgi:hypothetical protein